ncbi:hypothetical protein LCGC14_0628040 [marine sediment metagenome]|uniref:Uncharacterized protein n=1 Tax=marine sediment metagenome TaxID=412755 RepID=A0A0F9R808_9ZZZZ
MSILKPEEIREIVKDYFDLTGISFLRKYPSVEEETYWDGESGKGLMQALEIKLAKAHRDRHDRETLERDIEAELSQYGGALMGWKSLGMNSVEQMHNLKVESAKLISALFDEEAIRKAERERILKLLDDMFEQRAFADLHVIFAHFRQALKEGK